MKKTVLFISVLALLATGCEKDEAPIDPKNAIIGKWEITHLGNGEDLEPVENSISYREYLPDSLLRFYNYEDDRFIDRKYWIKDSLLIDSFWFIDDLSNDTITLENPYRFEFLNPNTVRLELQYSAIYTTSIYRRIN